MAKLTFQAFKDKWAALQGRFKTNFTFDIDEEDYREFSQDIADSVLEPVELLAQRVEKLENPAPAQREGVKWKVAPKVSVEGNKVKVTPAESEFGGPEFTYTYDLPVAKESVVLPPDGFGTRVDILAATANNNGWAYIYGEEPGITPAFQLADQPEVELLFAAYLYWTNAGGGTVEQPAVVVKVVEIEGQDYAPDPTGRLKLPPSGKVDTVNSQLPDATKNIVLEGHHIDTAVNDTTWWGTAKIKLKGVADRLANEIKLLQQAMPKKADLGADGKVLPSQLPAPTGGGGVEEIAYAAALKFDKSYKTTRNAAAADSLTLASNPAPVYHNRHTIYYAAGSVKPTFSAAFVALWDNWKQDAAGGNIVTCVYLPSGKVGYDIRYY